MRTVRRFKGLDMNAKTDASIFLSGSTEDRVRGRLRVLDTTVPVDQVEWATTSFLILAKNIVYKTEMK